MRCKSVLLALALAQAAASGIAQEVCAVPANVEAPSPRRADVVNDDLPVDYHALVLSWSPQFCEGRRNRRGGNRDAFQCSSANRFEWVVHGLWPQNGRASSGKDHPRHCKASGALPPALLKRHLCMMPGADLMQNEWQAHGTCGWSTPDRYFADIDRVYSRLRRPTTADMLGAAANAGPDRLVETTAGDIKQAFLKLNPSLPQDSLRVSVASGSRLKEVWVCLDKGLNSRIVNANVTIGVLGNAFCSAWRSSRPSLCHGLCCRRQRPARPVPKNRSTSSGTALRVCKSKPGVHGPSFPMSRAGSSPMKGHAGSLIRIDYEAPRPAESYGSRWPTSITGGICSRT